MKYYNHIGKWEKQTVELENAEDLWAEDNQDYILQLSRE